ncbi:hypothetical protein PENSUB_104 [Penicillium subrubescens]|uniref:Uncharacterized protein n=1 Tax=Penicillium subrubescens TaxID=1316194 RepID=A0A1Q5UNZ0_9EURO|nr:hypothetical protein PENSUB_104 [Penicillium subrubescens]
MTSTHTFYDGTIPVLQSLLRTLTHILQKASNDPSPAKTEATFFSARLTPDMYPLPDQIRIATQFSENLVARLTNREPVKFEGSPTTFAQSYERINTVLKSLDEADKETVNGLADVLKPTQLGPEIVVDMSCAGEIDKANSEFKLNDDELQIFKDILDREVMKDTLAVHSPGEGENSAKEIKKSEYLALSNVSNNTVDKMLKKLGKDKSTLS